MKHWWRKFRNRMVEKYLLPKYDKPFVVEHHYFEVVKIQSQYNLSLPITEVNEQLPTAYRRIAHDMVQTLMEKNIIKFELLSAYDGRYPAQKVVGTLLVSIPKN